MVLKLSPEQMTISMPPFEKTGIVLTEKNANSISGKTNAATTILRMSDCLSVFNMGGRVIAIWGPDKLQNCELGLLSETQMK